MRKEGMSSRRLYWLIVLLPGLLALTACGEAPLVGEDARVYPPPSAVARTSRPTESPAPPLSPAAGGRPTGGPLPTRAFGELGFPFPRPAGAGTIVEWTQPDNSLLDYENLWVAVIGDREIEVIAGAQVTDGTNSLPRPLPSVLVVRVRSTENSAFIRAESGRYDLPVADGPARIVDAVGTRLTVATQGGMGFYFDVATRQFTRLDGPVQRPAGDGTIVESGAPPFSAPPEYTFTNQWYAERGGERVTVLAGSTVTETVRAGWVRQAILFVAVTPVGQPVEFAGGTVYPLFSESWSFYSARVVGVEGSRLMLATGPHEVIFDLATRRVVKPADFYDTPVPLPTQPPRTPAPPTPVPPTPEPYPTSYP